jgi:hypothetical protein
MISPATKGRRQHQQPAADQSVIDMANLLHAIRKATSLDDLSRMQRRIDHLKFTGSQLERAELAMARQRELVARLAGTP